MTNKVKQLFQLFFTTFLISASTSGGYTIVSMIKDKFVNKNKWLSEEEMIDYLAIAQSTPGPIAINTSILAGYKIAGIAGAILTALGTTLPPLIIMSIVASFYSFFADNQIIKNLMHGMQAGVCALLINVTFDMFVNLSKEKSILSYILMILSFIIARFTNINIFFVAIACAMAGVIKALIIKKEGINNENLD